MRTTIEIFGHTTYILLAFSYLVRDIVWLRMLAIPACICSMIFSYFGPDEPLWLVFNWNVVFLVVNLSQLGRTFGNRRVMRRSPDLIAFTRLVPRLRVDDATQLFKVADVIDGLEGEAVFREGQKGDRLIFLLQGRANVHVRGSMVSQSIAGCFLGEISFFTGRNCTATVSLSESSSLLVWEGKKLRRLLKRSPNLNIALQDCLTNDLIEKLQRRDATVAQEAMVAG